MCWQLRRTVMRPKWKWRGFISASCFSVLFWLAFYAHVFSVMSQTGNLWTPERIQSGLTRVKLGFFFIGVCIACLETWYGFGIFGNDRSCPNLFSSWRNITRPISSMQTLLLIFGPNSLMLTSGLKFSKRQAQGYKFSSLLFIVFSHLISSSHAVSQSNLGFRHWQYKNEIKLRRYTRVVLSEELSLAAK